MRITCEQCHTTYRLSDERVPVGGAQVQCTACQHVFLVRHPFLEDTVVLNPTEKELLASLLADLALLRQAPDVQVLEDVDDEPTVRSVPAPRPSVGLREIANVRQVPGESPRRWFTSSDLDLILWLGPQGKPRGFQLCYGKRDRDEQALTWWPERGLSHSKVDEGRSDPLHVKATPILESAGAFDSTAVLSRFLGSKGELSVEYVDFVSHRLQP